MDSMRVAVVILGCVPGARGDLSRRRSGATTAPFDARSRTASPLDTLFGKEQS
jgi:hypothetical protein